MDGSVIIIGSGLGGLECGYILAKHGMKVTVLEQSDQTGGCLQTFVRGRALFDTGFHYAGGLGDGEPLNILFRYFGLMDLPWVRMDPDCFDEVVIGDMSFPFAGGHRQFAQRLAGYFPHEKDAIIKYTQFLKNVGDHIFDCFSPRNADGPFSGPLFSRPAYGFLAGLVRDPLLRQVLSGTSLKMELAAESLPLYVFAQINDSFIRSSWRLRGGGSLITDSLADSIRKMGGEVRTDTEVTAIREKGGRVAGVEVNGGEMLDADFVVSDIHPAETVALIWETKAVRKVYRRRISALGNTFGMFTANIRLKPGSLKYINRNIYLHRAGADVWNPRPGKTDSVLVSWSVPYDGTDDAISLDLLSPMWWSEVEKWYGLPYGHRGEDYVQFTRMKTEECMSLAERRIPGLRDAVDRIYTSTPLSYRSCLCSPEGSAYGVRKDWRSPMTTVLAPKTPLPGLLLTGQSLGLHGLLGVSMTSVFTCAEIIGLDALATEILCQNNKT